mmetsp:Transcript_10821/g.45068  ORF Transcript_10821/g.45068 Transcript_10821/m.45068 type:complete len:258 (-) Transcript_10821:394-1167(-)
MLRIRVLVSHLISPSLAARMSPSTRSFFRPALPAPFSLAIALSVSNTLRTVSGFGLANVTCRRLNATATSPRSPSSSFMRATVCLDTPAVSAIDAPTVAPPTTSSLPTSCLSAHLPNVRYTAADTSRGARSMISTNMARSASPFRMRLAEDDSSSKHRERRRYGVSASDVGHGESSVRDDPAPPPSAVGRLDESGPDPCSASVATILSAGSTSETSTAWSSDFGGARAAMGGGAWSSDASARSTRPFWKKESTLRCC